MKGSPSHLRGVLRSSSPSHEECRELLKHGQFVNDGFRRLYSLEIVSSHVDEFADPFVSCGNRKTDSMPNKPMAM
ncbi:MAG: hypothetical protein NZ921_03080 [Candidatus Caldarchaeum sp.]|nr:hypothetical protein [Candidatus Caldarchaeum sp.]